MRTILLTVSGSRSYGIHHSESDLDIKGVGLADPGIYLGFLQNLEQITGQQVVDLFHQLNDVPERAALALDKGCEGTVYELQKFFKMACDANPNILDVLFCRDEDVIYADELGEKLREFAPKFISSKAKHTFCGYAHSQLSRIVRHREWLLSPPTHQPTRTEFGLPERTLLPKDDLAVLNAAVQKKLDQWELDLSGLDPARRQHIKDNLELTLSEVMATADDRWVHAARSVGVGDNIIDLMMAERKYGNAKKHWKQYCGWKRDRNPERAALEEKHGYDCKHGAHLYRLLSMGHEVLSTGEVNVWRGDRDADVIRDIRMGGWSYERLVEWAKAKDIEVRDLYLSMYKSKTVDPVVPHNPPRVEIDKMCQQMVLQHLTT